METIIMHPKSKEQLEALKTIAKVLNVEFETEEASLYEPEFVKKVLQGKHDIQNGKGVKVDVENLWK